MAGLYRQVYATFWSDPKVVDQFSPEDKLFYLYLLTNEHANQCGIYPISLKQIAFDLGYSIETVRTLMTRFEGPLGRIKYNQETSEICILNWPKYNYPESIQDKRLECIRKELGEVKDQSLIDAILSKVSAEVRGALGYPAEDEEQSKAPYKPLISPLVAPIESHTSPRGNNDNDKDNNKDKERESACVRVSSTEPKEKESPRASLLEPETPAHLKLAQYWFRRFNTITATTMMPDEKSAMDAKRLLDSISGDLKLAMSAVDFYFDHWPSLWFACSKPSRNAPPGERKPEFRFSSFSNQSNFQEILSQMKSWKAEEEKPKRWSSGIDLSDDEDLAPPEERAAVMERIKSLGIAKLAAVVR